MTPCPNRHCRHRTKRKLRPLIITVSPPTSPDNILSSSHQCQTLGPTQSQSQIQRETQGESQSQYGGETTEKTPSPQTPTTTPQSPQNRKDQIVEMFTNHPSLKHHFETPVFSPGVPSRELRNRIKLLGHCRMAGLVPDVEWEGIVRAVGEQMEEIERMKQMEHMDSASVGESDFSDVGNANSAGTSDCDGTGGIQSASNDELTNENSNKKENPKKHVVIDPFRYLTKLTRVEDPYKKTITTTNNSHQSTKNTKKYFIEISEPLIPISPFRRGSSFDLTLPYSMELWRKAKTLTRDRSIFACTLAHLIAMRTLVKSETGDASHESCGVDAFDDLIPRGECNNNRESAPFDFILEDNVRAFNGVGKEHNVDDKTSTEWTGWSCECANRIWDLIEASEDWEKRSRLDSNSDGNGKDSADNSYKPDDYTSPRAEWHMRYYGWLGSLPNLTWTYRKHIPRTIMNGDSICKSNCRLFPFTINDDLELDSISTTKASKNGLTKRLSIQELSTEESIHSDESNIHCTAPKNTPTPHFTNPGGTPIFGTFAYTISPKAYRSLICQLQNDVGSMLWKSKRMRAYHAKAIDKIIPRHVKTEFGRHSVHLSDKVAFVRGPMLGSLLHKQWDKSFCESTEWQFRLTKELSPKGNPHDVDGTGEYLDEVLYLSNNFECAEVWDHVWLTDDEKRIVEHRKKTGEWVGKDELGNQTAGG